MMETMKRMASKKSHSRWWDSHISPKNSRWLADNLEAMDRLVKEMLKLIEEEGDSFAKKAEMYYKRRPELVSHVDNFYRMYRALAGRYDQVTGELRRSVRSGLQSKGSAGSSEFGSDPPSPPPEQTSDQKLSRSKSRARAAGFDFFLGSGGSSDSRKGSDDSSSSESESESDGDEVKEMTGDLDPDHLCPRIMQLESELRDTKEKLQQYEQSSDKGLTSRVAELEAALTAANEKLQESHEVIEQLRQNLEKRVQVEVEPDVERRRKSEVEEFKAAHFTHEKSCPEAGLVDPERSMDELKACVERFSQERLVLEAKISEQAHAIEKLNDMMASSPIKFSEEKLKLEKDILSLLESHAPLQMKLGQFEEERRQLETEKTEVGASNEKRTEELSQNPHGLKMKLDMLFSEREELSVKVSVLSEDVKRRDDQIREMDVRLQQLHLEHVKLITEGESSQKASREMNERIKDLEEEVERQQAVISDSAEKKREVIRQLCFSLEHYRDGYKQLRQVLLDHRRLPTVLAS